MADYKIICPKCFATVVTSHPEAMMWELCPACRRHVWEAYDLLMAEIVIPGKLHSKAAEIM